MTKTVVVRVDRLKQHAKYRTHYRSSQKFKADVPDAAAFAIGDIVRIVETRPLSKDKRWRVVDVVRKATAPLTDESSAEAATPEHV